VYRCPGDQVLRFISQCATTQRRVFEAPAAACATCALREQCTTARRGRRVGRSLAETYLERVRGYHATEAHAKAMRKRKVWVEPLFAEAKDWHGLRRFRLRGLEKVNGAAVFIATGQNLKRLLSKLGLGAPSVAQRSGRDSTPDSNADNDRPAVTEALLAIRCSVLLPTHDDIRLFQQAGPFVG
jgi:hypothetical protein